MRGWHRLVLALATAASAACAGCGRRETPVAKPAILASARIAIWKCDCQHPQQRWAAAADVHPTCPCGARCDCDHGPLAVYRVEMTADIHVAGGPQDFAVEIAAKPEAKGGEEPSVLTVRVGERPPVTPTPGVDGAAPRFMFPKDARQVRQVTVTLRVREIAEPVDVQVPIDGP